MRTIRGRETEEMSTASSTVEEAARLTKKIVQHERGKCGGGLDLAFYRVSAKWGVDEGPLRMLWKRAGELKAVKGHILDRLRQIDEVLNTAAERERTILAETAQLLEERGSSAAWLARKAADLAGEKEVSG
jgi:hypothetical protein